MSIATRTGDRGQTSLMYGRRVSKFDLRVETYGTVDELNSALGLARAHARLPLVADELLLVQKQLVALMGELAVAPEDAARYAKDKYPKLTEDMLRHLDALVAQIESEKITFDGWATPGGSVASAALDVARTVCRRAERLVAELASENEVDLLVIRYLNRLSDLLWLMARYTETHNLALGGSQPPESPPDPPSGLSR
jgi:cob(I)alamin adenosyltransferase